MTKYNNTDYLSIEKTRELLESAPDSYVVINKKGIIQFANKQTEIYFGYSQDELINKPLGDLLPKRFREKYQERFQTYFSSPHTKTIGPNLQLYGLKKDGTEFPVHVRIAPIHSNGEILIAGSIRDITEIRMLQEQLLRAQRLEIIGTLASGMAHDLNNALVPITLSVQLLKNYEKQKDEKYSNWINMIEESTKRATNLINQVLTFGRGATGEHNILQPDDFIKEVVKILNQTFPKSLKIQQNISDDVWSIKGDMTQLQQILINICVNARDAMPEGGTLTIDVGNIHLDKNYVEMDHNATIGPYILITITDTGFGVPQGNIDKIFDPFFTTKDPGMGTGLGLSTAYKMVQDHGGFINVYSEEGKGTKFNIYLPAIKDAKIEEQKKQEVLQTPIGNGETILVVDDEAIVREIIKFTLIDNGYNAYTAIDGVDAIATYSEKKDHIDLAIVDTVMPNMTGPTCIEVLRRINPNLKIILSSGLNDNTHVLENKGIEVNAKLTKPYNSETLLNSIYKTLTNE